MWIRFVVLLLIAICSVGEVTAEQGKVEYLSDMPQLIAYSTVGLGVLGFNAAVHTEGAIPAQLRIKDKTYAHGLGVHAPSEIVVDLNGKYDRFDTDIGVQWQNGSGPATVHFTIYVDDRAVYSSFTNRDFSGIMQETGVAKHVSIALTGAYEMRLIVGDGYDTNSGDLANWADARLTRRKYNVDGSGITHFNIGRFARIASWDPARMDGTHAGRLQSFPLEDITIENELAPDVDGIYAAPLYASGTGCIGLQWYESRRFRSFGLRFAHSSEVPDPARVRVQCWLGESPHQGKWIPVVGAIERSGVSLTLNMDYKLNHELRWGTPKVRWILPQASGDVKVTALTADSQARWKTIDLTVESPLLKKPGMIEVYNGELLTAGKTALKLKWDPKRPIKLRVRTNDGPWKADRTVLRFDLPGAKFAAAVDDVLARGCMFVRQGKVFIADAKPSSGRPIARATYLKQIAGHKTILDRVRAMPDQEFSRSMAITHNPIQDNGPTMLSLAADGRKFFAHRNGAVKFDAPGLGATGRLRPIFGSGKNAGFRRRLDGGWLPAPMITVQTAEPPIRSVCL